MLQETIVDERINRVNEIIEERQKAAQEQVTTEVAANTEVEPAKVEPIVETTKVEETPTSKSWKDEFFESTGMQFSDEVVTKLKTEPKPYEFKSVLSKKLEEAVERGISEKDFLKMQSTDWDSISPEEGMKKVLEEQNKDLSSEEVEILFKRKYKIPKPLDPAEFSEDDVAERNDDIKAAQIQLKSDWAQFRDKKKEEQVKFGEPKERSKEDIEAETKQIELANLNYTKTLSAFEKKKEIVMEVKDGEEVKKFSYKLNSEEDAKAKYILENPHRFINLFMDKDGHINSDEFIEAVYSMVGGKKAKEAFMRDYAGEILGLDVQQRKNIDFTKAQQNATPTLTTKEKAVEELRAKRYGI